MSILVRDQATDLRRLVASREALRDARPARRKAARVIAIASGKGGVGKTNIAVNLAILLSRIGRRVVLVDADWGTANIDVLMNVQSRFDLSHVLRRERTIDEVAIRVDKRLHIVAGASGLAASGDLGPCERQDVVSQLGRLEDRNDLILLDCGAGVSPNVLAFARHADELLVVTTPEPTALTDAYALVKVLRRASESPTMSLIVNQANTEREGRLVADRVADVATRFLGATLTCAGQILRDQHVALAVRQRTPVVLRYPGCPAAACLAALAARVARTSGEAIPRKGFFRRVMSFLY